MMQQQLDITHYSPSLLTILESDVAEVGQARGVDSKKKRHQDGFHVKIQPLDLDPSASAGFGSHGGCCAAALSGHA